MIPTSGYLRLKMVFQQSVTATAAKPAKLFPAQASQSDIETYKAMTKEELINELILAKANELRAKKGYIVKGVGADKEYIPLNNKNTKL